MLSRRSSASPPPSPKLLYLENTNTFGLSPPPRSSTSAAWHSTAYDLHAGSKRGVDRRSTAVTPPSPLARGRQPVDHSDSSTPSPVSKDYNYGFAPHPVTPPLGTPPNSSTIYDHLLGFGGLGSQSSSQAKKVSSVDNLKKSSLGSFPPSSSSAVTAVATTTTAPATTTSRVYLKVPPLFPPPPPPPPPSSGSGTKDRPKLTLGISALTGGGSSESTTTAVPTTTTAFTSTSNSTMTQPTTNEFEPDDEWKKSLRSSIQSRLVVQIDVAKQERHRKLIQLSRKYAQIANAISTTADRSGGGGSHNNDGIWGDRDLEKEKASRAKEIEEDFAKSMKSIRVFQEKTFEREVERERMERRKKKKKNQDNARADHSGQTIRITNGIPTTGGGNGDDNHLNNVKGKGVVSRGNGTEGRKEKETTIGDRVSRPIVNEDSSSDEEETEVNDRRKPLPTHRKSNPTLHPLVFHPHNNIRAKYSWRFV